MFYERLLLKNNQALNSQPTICIKDCHVFSSKKHDTAMTFVVMPTKNISHLKRCIFALAKQRRKDIQIIIVTEKHTKKFNSFVKRTLKRVENVVILTIKNCCELYSLHVFILKHVKGNYVTFVKASDVVHPMYSASMLSCVCDSRVDFILHEKSCGRTFFRKLSNGVMETTKISYSDIFKKDNSVLSFSNEDLYHSLFLTEKLRSVISENKSEKVAYFSSLCHVISYINTCTSMIKTETPFIRENASHDNYSIKEAILYTHSVSMEINSLFDYFINNIGNYNARLIINYIIYHTIPNSLSNILKMRFGVSKIALIYSNTAIYLAKCIRMLPDCQQKILYHTFAGLNYGRFMSSPVIHAMHRAHIKKYGEIATGITFYDEENLPEGKRHLMPELQKHYNVIALEKSSFAEHRQLEILVHAVLTAQTIIVIASQLVPENMVFERKVLQLWHGCGFLKQVKAPAPPSRFSQEYRLASSEACKSLYPKIYGLSPEKVLSIGAPQTDRYFDREQVAAARRRSHAEFQDITGKRVCFFAPTFRQWHKKRRYANPPYYRCGWNYEEMDAALQQADTIIVYKEHQKLKSFAQNMRQNFCDLQDSPGGNIRGTMIRDIFDWVCGCDVFMTDYSSAMLYPLLLNKPLVFYAPDLDEYCLHGNDFYIDYRKDVPGPIVTKPSPGELLEAMDAAQSFVGSTKYIDFKERHLGYCDGCSTERLLRFLETWYASEEKRINRRIGVFT